ncbi:MAG: hypothetical protein JXR27_13860, partial [Paludibacteraceae bacterium]|nr:hypothetical protein [Paludibacteraceae bacterium]
TKICNLFFIYKNVRLAQLVQSIPTLKSGESAVRIRQRPHRKGCTKMCKPFFIIKMLCVVLLLCHFNLFVKRLVSVLNNIIFAIDLQADLLL